MSEPPHSVVTEVAFLEQKIARWREAINHDDLEGEVHALRLIGEVAGRVAQAVEDEIQARTGA